MRYELINEISGEDAFAGGRRVRDLIVLTCVFSTTFLAYGLVRLIG